MSPTLFRFGESCYNPSPMSDVFISYPRRDIDVVRHLFDQLTAHDHEPWADWLAKIYTGIEAADACLLVIVCAGGNSERVIGLVLSGDGRSPKMRQAALQWRRYRRHVQVELSNACTASAHQL